MHVIQCDNVNTALARGLEYLYYNGIEEPSRNGPVIVAPGPVTTVYAKPWQRVLFSPVRNANPYFHLFEALWILAGRNDIAFPAYFAKQMLAYSDDGVTQRGAYGHRWRKWFGYDQLRVIANELRKDPSSRRCVLGMWDAGELAYAMKGSERLALGENHGDLLCVSKDKPCNTHIYFDCRGGKLNMTVCNRSNDIWWGAYGANAVHFSFLQEYMASWIGVEMGEYRQISNNYHIYTSVVPKEKFLEHAEYAENTNWYLSAQARPHFRLLVSFPAAHEEFDKELDYFFRAFPIDGPLGEYKSPGEWRTLFLLDVAVPMFLSWRNRKLKYPEEALRYARMIRAADWREACISWLVRKDLQKQAKESTTA